MLETRAGWLARWPLSLLPRLSGHVSQNQQFTMYSWPHNGDSRSVKSVYTWFLLTRRREVINPLLFLRLAMV